MMFNSVKSMLVLTDDQNERLVDAVSKFLKKDIIKNAVCIVDKFLYDYYKNDGWWYGVEQSFKNIEASDEEKAIFMCGYMTAMFLVEHDKEVGNDNNDDE